MPASLDDILTTQKNGVVAINNLSTSINRDQGTVTSATFSSDTLVITGRGYVSSFSITVAGSASGTINNAQTTALAAPGNVLCATPSTIGIYRAGLVFTNGLVIKPGAGQSINVTYSLG
jgi:hypothetical protein